MSNTEPEGPTPKQPYEPPPVPGNEVTFSASQIADAMTSIAAVNAKVGDLLFDTKQSLDQLRAELEKANEIRNRDQNHPPLPPPATRRVQPGRPTPVTSRDIEPTDAYLEGRAASQQELERQRNESIQRQLLRNRLRPQAEQQLQQYRAMPFPRQLDEMESLGVIYKNDQGVRGRVIGDQFVDVGDIASSLNTPAEARNQEQQTLAEEINTAFREHITDELERRAPRTVSKLLDAVEDSGIRQLRYGQLTMQDILRSFGTLAGRASVRLAEAQEEAAVYAQRMQQRQAAIAAGMPEDQLPDMPQAPTSRTGRLAQLHPGLVGRAAGVLGIGGDFLPMAGQALAIGQVVSGMYNRIYAPVAGAIRQGQVTGEGFQAGIGARLQAFGLGLNPFDMVSGQMAREIVSATRERGFVGGTGRDVQEGIRSVVNDLGISVDMAADYFTDSMRRGGMSVDQVRKQLERFDDAAHDLNMNVTEYTQAVMQNTQSFRQLGAGSAAPQLAQAAIRALPAGFRDQGSIFAQLIQQNRGAITARLNAQGVPANIIDVTSARYIPQAARAVDDLIRQDMQVAQQGWQSQHPGQGPPNANDLANWMSQAGIYTRGMDPTLLANYMRRLQAGLGLGAQQQASGAVQTLQHTLEAHRGYETRNVQQLSANQRHELGITTRTVGGDRGPRHTYYYDRNGNRIGIDQSVRAMRDIEDVPEDEMVRAREAALAALPKGYATRKELTDLRNHIRDRRFKFEGHDVDFTEAIRRIGESNRSVNPSQVVANGVTIELKGKAAQDLFKLNIERQRAVNNGSLPSNTNPSRVYTPSSGAP